MESSGDPAPPPASPLTESFTRLTLSLTTSPRITSTVPSDRPRETVIFGTLSSCTDTTVTVWPSPRSERDELVWKNFSFDAKGLIVLKQTGPLVGWSLL